VELLLGFTESLARNLLLDLGDDTVGLGLGAAASGFWGGER